MVAKYFYQRKISDQQSTCRSDCRKPSPFFYLSTYSVVDLQDMVSYAYLEEAGIDSLCFHHLWNFRTIFYRNVCILLIGSNRQHDYVSLLRSSILALHIAKGYVSDDLTISISGGAAARNRPGVVTIYLRWPSRSTSLSSCSSPWKVSSQENPKYPLELDYCDSYSHEKLAR